VNDDAAGVAKRSLKKKFKAENKKTAAHTAVEDHPKNRSQKLLLQPLTLQVIVSGWRAGWENV
jgi:hypothetical protein